MTDDTLREALAELEAANDALCAVRSQATYDQMIADGNEDALARLDEARSKARAAINQSAHAPSVDAETVERVAKSMVVPLGYHAKTDWGRTFVGNQFDTTETGSLAYLCRSLARAAIRAMQKEGRE